MSYRRGGRSGSINFVGTQCTVNENTCGWNSDLSEAENNTIPDSDERDCYCPLNQDYEYLGDTYEQRHQICVSICMPDQRIDEDNNDECLDCPEGCDYCWNGNNCNLCNDPRCAECN
jgi:hypothetical protein